MMWAVGPKQVLWLGLGGSLIGQGTDSDYEDGAKILAKTNWQRRTDPLLQIWHLA